ncbi:MAG: carotenoid oxygenase family protein, partial [Microthrixaceae bacterium]
MAATEHVDYPSPEAASPEAASLVTASPETASPETVGSVTNHRNQPMLGGLFTPLATESDEVELEVSGELPSALQGMFIRNGPNPMFEPRGGYHMFDGDAMLHRVVFGNSLPTYKSRWIQTAALQAEIAAGRSLYGGLGELHLPSRREVGTAGPIKNPANTNIVQHAGRFLALYEAAPATEVTAQLATVGVHTFDGALTGPFTAHPKVDPVTDELHAFSYLSEPPYLQYHQIDAAGEFVRTVDIELSEAVVMHDFVVT